MLIECKCGCGNLINRYDNRGREKYYVNGHSGIKTRFNKGDNSLENNIKWKGGIIHSGNYIFILKPDHPFASKTGYVREHRLVWEKYHKAILLPWSDVHHINKITTDNRPENLQAMMSYQHVILENMNRIRDDYGRFKPCKEEDVVA